MANNDGYIKVEDTIPPILTGKSQEDIGWPTEVQKKSLRTLGSFSNPQQKEITGIQEPIAISKKDSTELSMPIQTQYKEPSIFVEPVNSSSKDSVTVVDPQRLAKDSVSVDDSNVSLAKSSSSIPDTVTGSHKSSQQVSEPRRLNSKDDLGVNADVPHSQKSPNEVSADISHDTKDEQIVNVNGVYRNKNGEPVAVFKDHLAKRRDDIGLSDEHSSKEEVVVKAQSDLSKTESKINTNITHKSKGQLDVNVFAPSWTKKDMGEDLTSEIGSVTDGKAEIVPEAIDSVGSGNIDQLAQQSKGLSDIESVDSRLSKSELELEKLSSHKDKNESEIDTSRTHQVKKEYSYDEILKGYLKQVEEEQEKKKSTASHESALNVSSNRAFNDTVHIDYSKVPHNAKDEPVANAYSTELDNKTNKTFEDVLPVSIPTHTFSPKETAAGFEENDIPRIDGLDIKPGDYIGKDNYVVSIASRTGLKTSDDIQDNTVSVENESMALSLVANPTDTTLFDTASEEFIGRTSSKIADRGATILVANPTGPKDLSNIDADVVYSEVRNSPDSEYRPVYDWTNLIPARIGLADLLRTATQTFGLTKYVAMPVFKPDMDNGLLRFGQRALTGEVARYVHSRLQNSVLMGYNPDKIEKRNERPAELSVSGVLDQADKLFDVLNPVVNFMTANPLDLFKNKEYEEFHGLLSGDATHPGMGPQIDRSASGMFSSMANYYNAVRAKITNRYAGYESNLSAIDAKIAKLQKRIEDGSADPEYSKPQKIIGADGRWNQRYEPSQRDYDEYALEHLKRRRTTYEDNIKKLNVQFANILINFDSPSEYTKYIDATTAFSKPEKESNQTYSISMKRSDDGPELDLSTGAPTNTQRVNPDSAESLDWRSFNRNRKPDSVDDFDATKGYLFKAENDALSIAKDKADFALQEQKIFANHEKRRAYLNDMYDYKYFMTSYDNSGLAPFKDEIIKYYESNNGISKNPDVLGKTTHFIPSKYLAETYASAISTTKSTFSYQTKNENEYRTGTGEQVFNDPHLSNLFEIENTSSLMPDMRKNFVDAIVSSTDNGLKTARDRLMVMTGSSYESAINVNEKFDISLAQSVENKSFFNAITQIDDIYADPSSSDIDMSNFGKNVLYQSALNYLTNLGTKPKRKARENLYGIQKHLEGQSDNPLGSGFTRIPNMYSFAWFKDSENIETSDTRKNLLNMLPDSGSPINTYPAVSVSKSATALYQKEMNITGYEGQKDSEIVLKDQVNTIPAREKNKINIPVGFSFVNNTQDQTKGTKAVAIYGTDNKLDIKYVTANTDITSVNKDTASLTMDNLDAGNKIFTVNSGTGETERDKTASVSYYAKIKKSREVLDKPDNYDMTIKVAGTDGGVITTRRTNLGGILVSTGYAMDRVKSGRGNLFFEIPFQFNPEISGESRSANWNAVTAFGRTHEHFIYSNSGARSIQFKTSYAVVDSKDGEYKDKMGEAVSDANVERNDMMDWAKGWTEDYVQMILNMYRSLTLPISAYSSVTPPIIMIDFGKYLGGYNRTADAYVNARWVVSEYSIDPNLDAGYTPNKTPRLYDVTLSLKEVYNGWHDLRDFYTLTKHLQHWEDGGLNEIHNPS